MVELSTKKLLIVLGRFYILVWLYIMILEAPNFGQIIITCSMLLESSQRLHNYIHWVYIFKLITVLRLVSTGTSSHFWLELYIVIHTYLILKKKHLGQVRITCSMFLGTSQRLHIFIGFGF